MDEVVFLGGEGQKQWRAMSRGMGPSLPTKAVQRIRDKEHESPGSSPESEVGVAKED